MEKIQAVKCEKCGNLHDINSETFVRFHGNVYIGMRGGIIGNNFKTDKMFENKIDVDDVGSTIYCRDYRCLYEIVGFMCKDTIPLRIVL
jgi:hypothetical protein